MTDPEAAPYETLARIFERELELLGSGRLELLGSGRLDQLDALAAEREALIAAMPATPPAAARPALERARLAQERVMIEIIRRREAVVLELAQLERVRRVARGYAPPRGASHFCADA